MPDRLEIYHRLPYPLRVVAASLWGLHLHNWRYGQETEKLIENALERERWTGQQWKNWQDERLAFVLHRAATQVPFYKDSWQNRRKNGNRASWEILDNWPILDKESVRRETARFVAEDCDTRKMYVDHTSGTTGTPLTIWFGKSTVKQSYAIYEARIRRWHNVSYKQPWGIFGGQLVTPVSQKTPPYWVKNYGLNQVYFSVLHISQQTYHDYLLKIQKDKLTHLVVYTNSLFLLSSEIPEMELPIRSHLRVVFTNAEPLYDFQRKRLEHVFGCPIKETYGSSEMICAASECEYGNMHWWPEVGITEIVDDVGGPTKSGETGRLIATGLLNADMPLIRYDTKDLTMKVPNNHHCGCQRNLPLAGKFVGRSDDVIITKDGRKLTQLDTIFDPHLPMKEAQIVQETIDKFTIRVVPDTIWKSTDAEYLINELKKRVGDVEVIVKEEKEIERTWAGKFRIIVSKLKIN